MSSSSQDTQQEAKEEIPWVRVSSEHEFVSVSRRLAEQDPTLTALLILGFRFKLGVGGRRLARVCEALKNNTVLQHLRLDYTDIGDEGAEAVCEAIADLRNLQHLDFHHNEIRDAGANAVAEAIANFNHLQHLNLSRNKIGDVGAEAVGKAIAKLDNLQHLDLSRNKFGDAGATAVGKAIVKLNNLQRLDLGDNNIGDAGATAVGEAIAKLDNLQSLSLDDNNIGDAGAKAVCEAIWNNHQCVLEELVMDYPHDLGQLLKDKLPPEVVESNDSADNKVALSHILELHRRKRMQAVACAFNRPEAAGLSVDTPVQPLSFADTDLVDVNVVKLILSYMPGYRDQQESLLAERIVNEVSTNDSSGSSSASTHQHKRQRR